MIMSSRDNSRKLTTLTPIPSQNKVVQHGCGKYIRNEEVFVFSRFDKSFEGSYPPYAGKFNNIDTKSGHIWLYCGRGFTETNTIQEATKWMPLCKGCSLEIVW